MCGIVGYIGQKNGVPIIIDGLKTLEYRGYDSCGVCYCNDSGLVINKKVGFVDGLENGGVANIGIGHTRWATHGKPSVNNAHPHVTSDSKLAIVHNGIIENAEDIKKDLGDKYHYVSDTDSEVLLYLIYDIYCQDNNLYDSVRMALEKVVGAYAILVLSSDENDQIVCARKGSPLAIGVGKGEYFIASDTIAFNRYTNDTIYLKDNYICKIERGQNLEFFDMSCGIEANCEIEKVYNNTIKIDKQNYEHYMLKEIYEQPNILRDCMRGRLSRKGVSLGGLSDYREIFQNANRLIILGCGTSWHSAILGKYFIEEICKKDVYVEYASEFRYRSPNVRKGDIVIGISQSGETADTLGALKMAKDSGAIVVGICNVVNSSLARMSDCGIYTRCGVEVGVASTKAFLSQILCLLLLSLWIKKDYTLYEDIVSLPDQIQSILENCEDIKKIAVEFCRRENALFLGRGYNFPIALEGALKLKEISYIHAEGYPVAEMKHGPIALIDKDVFSVVAATSQYDKISSSINEIESRDGEIILITNNEDMHSGHRILIPKSKDILSPFLAVVPMQLFAYYCAHYRGCNVDKPRNLAKSVTVE